MNEIKFRAYIKSLGWVALVEEIHFNTKTVELELTKEIGDTAIYEFDEVELMQYTGLKDKNGTEIYEGDIVEAISGTIGNPSNLKRSVYEIVINNKDSYEFGTRRAGREYISSPIRKSVTKYYSVIGNIYENKELLEGAE